MLFINIPNSTPAHNKNSCPFLGGNLYFLIPEAYMVFVPNVNSLNVQSSNAFMNTLWIFAQSLETKFTYLSTNLGGITSYCRISSCGVFYQIPRRHVFIWISIVLFSENLPEDAKRTVILLSWFQVHWMHINGHMHFVYLEYEISNLMISPKKAIFDVNWTWLKEVYTFFPWKLTKAHNLMFYNASIKTSTFYFL